MWIKIVTTLCIMIGTAAISGCWSKTELTEKGFVMGVAIDSLDQGGYKLTTQIYKPQKKGKEGKEEAASAYVNIVTSSDTILNALRNIPSELGRKSQWSHMRILLISERVAKKVNIGETLDFFYRDHEPRLTAAVLITEGAAKPYLENEPVMEQTTSQQILRGMESYSQFAAKTANTHLLEIGKQLKSEAATAVISYISPKKEGKGGFRINGNALIKKGIMVGKISADQSLGLSMLRNELSSGVFEVPCDKNAKKKGGGIESFEIMSLSSKVVPSLVEGQVHVDVTIHMKGAMGEMRCSVVKSAKDEEKLLEKVENIVRKEVMSTISLLKKQKVDVLRIGDRLHMKDSSEWKKLKENWDKHFAEAQFTIRVEARLETSGTVIGKPAFQP